MDRTTGGGHYKQLSAVWQTWEEVVKSSKIETLNYKSCNLNLNESLYYIMKILYLDIV